MEGLLGMIKVTMKDSTGTTKNMERESMCRRMERSSREPGKMVIEREKGFLHLRSVYRQVELGAMGNTNLEMLDFMDFISHLICTMSGSSYNYKNEERGSPR